MVFSLKKTKNMMYHKRMTYSIMPSSPPKTSKITSYHGRFSVLNAFTSQFKLKVYKYSHCHHCKSTVLWWKSSSLLTILSCYLVHLFILELHLGTLAKNIIIHMPYPSFLLLKKYYHIDSELTTFILSSPFCSVKACSIC